MSLTRLCACLRWAPRRPGAADEARDEAVWQTGLTESGTGSGSESEGSLHPRKLAETINFSEDGAEDFPRLRHPAGIGQRFLPASPSNSQPPARVCCLEPHWWQVMIQASAEITQREISTHAEELKVFIPDYFPATGSVPGGLELPRPGEVLERSRPKRTGLFVSPRSPVMGSSERKRRRLLLRFPWQPWFVVRWPKRFRVRSTVPAGEDEGTAARTSDQLARWLRGKTGRLLDANS
eukprot:g12193.t1